MALTDSLISYWKCDEASGNILDAHSTNDLTESGTGGIGATTGKINGCRDFEAADADVATHADNAALSTGDIDFTFAGWAKPESDGVALCILQKGPGNGFSEFECYRYSDNHLYFSVARDDVTSATVGSTGTVVAGNWYYIVVWHDSVGNSINMQINNGSVDTQSYSSGGRDTADTFYFGGYRPDVATQYWDGLLDEWGFWKRVLTSQERTDLYNGGSGLAYPFASGRTTRNTRSHPLGLKLGVNFRVTGGGVV